MQIYPAIDLINQQCVRLYQGKFEQATIYSSEPCSTAKAFAKEGAKWLHLIDLDAAKDAKNSQKTIIAEILKAADLSIQLGGGIRCEKQINVLFDLGITRVIIGSLTVKKPMLVKNIIKKFGPEKIVLAFDANFRNKTAFIAMAGWQETTDFKLFDKLEFYYSCGLKHALCTDISRDGTLLGPNIDLYKKILLKFPKLRLQASGGIANLNDLKSLGEMDVSGAIIGRALYENKMDLRETLKIYN